VTLVRLGEAWTPRVSSGLFRLYLASMKEFSRRMIAIRTARVLDAAEGCDSTPNDIQGWSAADDSPAGSESGTAAIHSNACWTHFQSKIKRTTNSKPWDSKIVATAVGLMNSIITAKSPTLPPSPLHLTMASPHTIIDIPPSVWFALITVGVVSPKLLAPESWEGHQKPNFWASVMSTGSPDPRHQK
jgi:hypothetical protein